MMNHIYLILAFILITLSVNSQNLVPNPDFEDYTECPDNGGQLNRVEHWYKISNSEGTPDFYHRCFDTAPPTSIMGIPINWNGYQESKSGDAYVGVFNYGYDDVREYIQVELLESLLLDKFYEVSMYVNTADRSGIAVNSMGIHISENAISGNGEFLPLDVIPQIANPVDNIMTDTAEWTLISGYYQAKGNERFLTIGNFLNDSLTETMLFDGGGGIPQGYSYIDLVSVTEVDSIISNQINSISIASPTVFPNPTNNFVTLEFHHVPTTHQEIKVLDMLGRQVFDSIPIDKQSIQLNFCHLESGVYLYQIIADNNTIFTGRIIRN